jgi:hypothetical protein
MLVIIPSVPNRYLSMARHGLETRLVVLSMSYTPLAYGGAAPNWKLLMVCVEASPPVPPVKPM